jgi:hypothetical protein
MAATAAEQTCKVRLDWRRDGRAQYRRLTLDEVREWGRKEITLGLYRSLTATTPASEVILGDDLRVWWFPATGTARYWIQCGDHDAIKTFVAVVERLLSGETAESILESF